MNIEKLAIEHGAERVHRVYDGLKDICFMFKLDNLEAFAKALQSSEPVFAEYLDDDEEWQKINVKDIGTYEHAMFKTRLLFTHPPATVPLEKYNNLLRLLIEAKYNLGLKNEVPLHNIFSKVEKIVSQAIAEAEGKEG